MKKVVFILILIICNNSYAQLKKEQSEIIRQVAELYEEDGAEMYYKIDNDLYEMEIDLLKKRNTQSKSEILKYLNINYKTLSKISRKTDKDLLSDYYLISTTENLKDESIAILSLPIISISEKKAILFGRYSCGIACGNIKIFYFTKEKEQWILKDIKDLKYDE